MSSQITVRVYLHSTLVEYSKDGKTRKFTIKIPAGSTINDLIMELGIEQPENHLLLLALNGKVAEEDQFLSENDSLHLMMPISGGKGENHGFWL